MLIFHEKFLKKVSESDQNTLEPHLLAAIEKIVIALFFPRYQTIKSGLFFLFPKSTWATNVKYQPVSPLKLYLVVRSLQERGVISKNSEIWDIGCGTGFLLRLLWSFGFRNIFGIEKNLLLLQKCRKNLGTLNGMDGLRFIEADATKFRLPPTARVIFLFNPFDLDTFRTFFENQSDNSGLVVVYINDVFNDYLASNSKYLKIIGLEKIKSTVWLTR